MRDLRRKIKGYTHLTTDCYKPYIRAVIETFGFSKKFENLNAALNLHFAYYNFCRIHGSLRITPAMKAVITDHIWSIEEILNFKRHRMVL